MPDTSTNKGWPELYRVALLEPDHSRLPGRIEEANIAIRSRVKELWYAGSPETRERRDLDAALRFLELLRMIGAEK